MSQTTPPTGQAGPAPDLADAAARMWQSWAELAGGSWGLPGATPPTGHGRAGMGADGFQAALAGLSRQWQALAEQSLHAWQAAGADPLLRQVAQQAARSQAGLVDLTQQLSRAWQAVAAQAGAGQDPAALAARWAEQLKRGQQIPQDLTAAGEDLSSLWQTWTAMLQQSLGPWLGALGQAPRHWGGALSGDRSELSQLTRLAWDAWEHTGGRLLESPSLGFGREMQERMQLAFDAWLDHRRAVADYQAVVAELNAEAMAAVARRLLERGEAGKPVKSLRELSAVWTQAADEVFEAGFRGDRYAAAQGTMVREAMRYRQAERAIVEAALRNTDIATRSELDEAAREIHQLRRELRRLRKEVEGLRPAAASNPAVAPSPVAASTAAPAAPSTASKVATRTAATSGASAASKRAPTGKQPAARPAKEQSA